MAFKAFLFLFLALILFTTGSSTKAPAHTPEKPPMAVHPPEKAPIAEPPAKATSGCATPCEERCKEHWRKRPCMKLCMACCRQCHGCVPPGTSGNEEMCPGWKYVLIHTDPYVCP